MPYYEDQYGWLDNEYPEPEEPEDTIVCTCDNCEEEILDCDDMAVVEEHRLDGRCHIKHICMDCWNANKWDKAEELLDMLGVWYWTGDAVDAMAVAARHMDEESKRYKRLIGTAVNKSVAAVANAKKGSGNGNRIPV